MVMSMSKLMNPSAIVAVPTKQKPFGRKAEPVSEQRFGASLSSDAKRKLHAFCYRFLQRCYTRCVTGSFPVLLLLFVMPSCISSSQP